MENLNDLREKYFGKTWRDTIGGFTGVATRIQVDINGVIDVCVVPKSLKDDGTMRPGQWIEANRLELVAGAPLILAGD